MTKETFYMADYIEHLSHLPLSERESASEYNRCISSMPAEYSTEWGANVKFEEFKCLVSIKKKNGSLKIFLDTLEKT